MIKPNQVSKSLPMLILVISIFISCDEKTHYQKPDYFPLNDQSEWKYQYEIGCNCPEEYLPFSDPTLLKVKGDTVLNGKSYSRIENDRGIFKVVRQEGDQYFSINLSKGTESVFLDTSVPVGSFWIVIDDDFWQHKFSMLEPIQKMKVNTIVYNDVLVVEDRVLYDDGQFQSTNSTYHYYVNGIGEILTHYSPSPYNQYGSKSSLLKFN